MIGKRDYIPIVNGMIIPLSSSQKSTQRPGNDDQLTDTYDADTEDEKNAEEEREKQDQVESDIKYYRIYCNAQNVLKALKETKDKQKRDTAPTIRAPRLEDVTGSLSPFASNLIGSSIYSLRTLLTNQIYSNLINFEARRTIKPRSYPRKIQEPCCDSC